MLFMKATRSVQGGPVKVSVGILIVVRTGLDLELLDGWFGLLGGWRRNVPSFSRLVVVVVLGVVPMDTMSARARAWRFLLWGWRRRTIASIAARRQEQRSAVVLAGSLLPW
jgi:hypothetical protein